MPRVGFEPMTPVFERTKTVHALDRAAGHCDRQNQPLGNDIYKECRTPFFTVVIEDGNI
jgi:hypothetical protein